MPFEERNGHNDEKRGMGQGIDTTLWFTDAEMKDAQSFDGFDFNDIWDISPSVNNGYPYLRIFNFPRVGKPIITNSTAVIINNHIVFTINTDTYITSQFMHIAVYNQNKLLDYITVPILGEHPQNKFYVVLKSIQDADYSKVFIWKDCESMEPLSDAETVPIVNF